MRQNQHKEHRQAPVVFLQYLCCCKNEHSQINSVQLQGRWFLGGHVPKCPRPVANGRAARMTSVDVTCGSVANQCNLKHQCGRRMQ